MKYIYIFGLYAILIISAWIFLLENLELQMIATMLRKIKTDIQIKDCEFDSIYPKQYREKSEFHFTPVLVAQQAAQFLISNKETRVLDIGSGLGKFCAVAGAVYSNGYFIGVEQRRDLYNIATQIAKKYKSTNTHFIHSNITNIDFKAFDSFYFFNSFYENIVSDEAIDNSVLLNDELYFNYSSYVKQQLEDMPIGTRLATYFSYGDEVPNSYYVHSFKFHGKLRLYEKLE